MGKRGAIEFIVRGVLRDARGRVLLCRNVKHNYHYLPGGHIEFGEAARTALAREFIEETGLRVRCGDLLASSENKFERKGTTSHEINLVFHAELVRPKAGSKPPLSVASLERKIAFDWVEPGEIGGLDVRPRGLAEWLARSESPTKTTWLSEIPNTQSE